MSGRLLKNAVMSVAQVVVTGVVFFVLYRFLLKAVGVEVLGVWSVVLATTSVGRLTNLGLNASVVKFVAQYLARGEREKAVEVLETAAITLGAVLAAVAVVFYPVARLALGFFIAPNYLDDAVGLLPWALVSLWLSVIAGVFQSGLDGLQRIDLRSSLMMGTTLLYLGLCLWWVPRHGILGLAYAQVTQVGGLLLLNAVVLRRLMPEMPLLPRRFRRPVFDELLGYGVHVQLMTVGSLMLEPMAKGLVSKFGGAAAAGYFEMANRMVVQLRQLLNGAAQAIVPAVAHRQETDAAGVHALYLSTYRALFFMIFPALAFTLACTPVVSELWVGHYEPRFVVMTLVLACGLYLGMLSSPAFFTNLGTGQLRWNTVATFTMLAVTGLPVVLTWGHVGGVGVSIGYAAGYVVGGAIIQWGFHRSQGLPLSAAVPRESLGVLVAAVFAAGAPLALYYALRPSMSLPAIIALSLLTYGAVLIVPVWRHPLRALGAAGLRRRLARRGAGA